MKTYHRNIEYRNALLKDAHVGLHSLVSLRKSIIKTQRYPDVKLFDSISIIIDNQHDLIERIER